MTTGTATYQITNFLSDYRNSNSIKSLNPNSSLVQAAGGVIGCGSMAPPNYDGVFGTYYAGVLYAAQSALVAQKAANPGSANVIILLSDGDATAPKTNGSNTVMGSPATGNGQYPSGSGSVARPSLPRNTPPARELWCTPSPMVQRPPDALATKTPAPIPTSRPAEPCRRWPLRHNTSIPIITRAAPPVPALQANRSPR